MDKREREMIKLAKEFGGRWERGTRHARIHLPSGRFVVVSVSASDHRALLNLRAQLRKESKP